VKQIEAVFERVQQLRNLHQTREREKEVLRALMAGTDEGLRTLLGDLSGATGYDVPSANLVMSGLHALARKLGRIPDLRTDPRASSDSESQYKKAEKRARIVTGKDRNDHLRRVLNKTALHLPGYGFSAWVVREKVTEDGQKYGGLDRLDSYSTYPGQSFADEPPSDLATVYSMQVRDLVAKYPQHRTALLGDRTTGGAILLEPSDWTSGNTYMGGSPTPKAGIEIVEYYDKDGCWVVVPSKRLVLEFYANPLSSPQFIVMQRYTLDQLVGHYDHVIGLQAQIARFNMLAAIAMEDAVFSETVVAGELLSGQWRRGRFAVNYVTPNTQVTRPTSNIPYQMFQEQDRMERQLRTTASYSVTDDAVSPAAQATGQGIDRLNQGIDMEVRQYLGILQEGLEAADRKRLEWDEKCYPNAEITVSGVWGGHDFEETYTPAKDIKGAYRTRRTYGAMAGLDDQNKISALLLLNQGELFPKRAAIEELDTGGRNVSELLDQIEDEKVSRTLMELMVSGQPVDPRVAMTLIEMLPESEKKETFKRFWTPEEPEMSPEQEAMLGQGAPAEPDIMSMLGLGGGGPAAGGMPPEMMGAVA
jgi:hypothetical protein